MRFIPTILVLAALTACSALGIGITPIGDIVANPSRFDNAEVRVKGRVTGVNKLPLLGTRIYTLRDDSGEISVVAPENGTLPAADSVVTIRAKVMTTAILQGEALGLRLAEIDRSTSPF